LEVIWLLDVLQIVRNFAKCSTKTYRLLLNSHVYSACSVISTFIILSLCALI